MSLSTKFNKNSYLLFDDWGIGGKCQVPPAPDRREELKEIVHAERRGCNNNVGNTYCGEPEADGMSARLPVHILTGSEACPYDPEVEAIP